LGVSLGGSYRLARSQDYFVDAVTGVRFWDLDNELRLTPGALPEANVSDHESWQDLFIGLKGRAMINESWYVSGWGVAAVTGDSSLAWDLFGAVGYTYSDVTSFVIGYRHQEVDYENGLFLFDVELSGPILGVSFRF
jgi:hypothetical protein